MTCETHRLRIVLALLLGMTAACAWAGPYDPPGNYYNGASGTGTTLKGQLDTIMTTGQVLKTYGDAREILDDTDEDPNNTNNVLLTYNRNSVSGTWVGNGAGVFGSREHVWPQSRFPDGQDDISNGQTGIGSDLHMLKPLDPGTNGNRSNRAFGHAATTGANRQLAGDFYFPGMADRGDIARILFYGATRWKDEGLKLVNGNGVESNQEMGDLASLLEWHYIDVPDTFELRRNHLIYGQQGNRNAYIDRPEYAWSVYADQQNDSRLYVGAGSDPNGASTANVNLGSVIVGAAVPSAQSVTLNKVGNDGVYYEVTTSGSATSSVTGRFNAFKINTVATDSRALLVGLDPNADTSTAGLLDGAITINNLDVTTAGGTGRGDRDQNDTINVSLAVLDHANPSFFAESDTNVRTLNFGSVTLGSSLPPLEFGIFNLAAPSGFTASLDLDGFSGSGNIGAFDLDLTTFTGVSALPVGMSNDFTALLDTSSVGNFSATYTLNFSDRNMPGATSLGVMTLNLIAAVTAPVEDADFNADGFVDFGDYLIWQGGLGIGSTLGEGDANGDHTVDADDLAIWNSQYGTGGLSDSIRVPEPSVALLMLCAAPFAIRRRRMP